MGSVLRRLFFLFQRRRFERDLDEELRFHEDMTAQALADAHDMDGEDARAAARRRLGPGVRLREEARDPWTFALLHTCAQDARHALRLMWRDPAFTATALATLALGIGLNAAIFSVAYGVLWRPLPYNDPDRLVMLSSSQQSERGIRTFSTWSPAAYEGLRSHVSALDDLAAYAPIDVRLTGRGEPTQVPALDVSPNFFATLGVQPAHGRSFLADATASGDEDSALVSDHLWRTTFGASPDVMGDTIMIDGRPRTIVGVLPPEFSFRPALRTGTLPEAHIFLRGTWPPDAGRSAFLFLLGRLHSGVTQPRLEAELSTLVNDPSITPPGAFGSEGIRASDVPTRAHAVGLQAYGTAPVRTLLLVLLAAVTVVLLIACVNVANLQMARLTGRRGELSVRMALGAGRRRIVRQLLTEAVVLSVMGGALGVVLAAVAMYLTLPLVPPALLPRMDGIVLDGRVLTFCVGLSLLATLLVGVLPALRTGGLGFDERDALRASETRTTSDRQGDRLRTLLVAGQIAMTLVLLIGAGLLIHSFLRLTSVSPGFDTSGANGVVQTVRVMLPEDLYDGPDRIHDFARGVLDRITYLPGVTSASLVNSAPFGRMFIQDNFDIEGQPRAAFNAGTPRIEAGYFATMGIPQLAGRDFTGQDTATAPRVAIVSERIVAECCPEGAAGAIGRRIRVGDDGEWMTVVGVVADIRQRGLDQGIQPMIYIPYQQDRSNFIRMVSFVVRTGTPASVVEGIHAEIRRVAPDLPIAGTTTMDDAVAASVAAPRFRTVLLGLFALSATLIAACGIYGLMAYSVSQRRREIGVRMALGANSRDVLRDVLMRALRIVVAGVLVGLLGAAAVTRVLQRFLFEVTPTDPMVFTAVTLLLVAIGLTAAWLPARRATRIDPWNALRAD